MPAGFINTMDDGRVTFKNVKPGRITFPEGVERITRMSYLHNRRPGWRRLSLYTTKCKKNYQDEK